ncbi:(d)CMP kinase [Amycolatopsis azurea]|uniref:(d)CMP kinase n=1 Tax=Amycolatopsis azurea TaxID=36819 RepID=UPI0037F54441
MPDTTTQMIVAVDGPAAAGKTTTSNAMVAIFGLSYLESGKIYRNLAAEALHRNLPTDNTSAIGDLCAELLAENGAAGALTSSRYTPAVLRSVAVTVLVPRVAGIPAVREHATAAIRRWAAERAPCIIEGRDIGTAVFPTAPVKFYLTASPAVRAERRVQQQHGLSYPAVLQDILRRDYHDMHREVAPLVPARDAIEIDTTDLTIHQVIHRMATAYRARRDESTAITPART